MSFSKKVKGFAIKMLENNKLIQNYARKNAMNNKAIFLAYNKKTLHKQWQNFSKRRLELYTKQKGLELFLLEQIKKLKIKQDMPILEIGCNVGRNLNFLFNAGFHKLYGIDINSHAISEMKKLYPVLYSNSKIITGSVEEKIKKFIDNEIFLTFTAATLQHIHPSSNFIFSEISRITSNYIITIEREKTSHIFDEFPRNYDIIFENLGWKQILSKDVDYLKFSSALGYVARIFQKVHKT